VAASAYRLLQSPRAQFTRVALLGPAHRVYLRGIGLSSAARFSTPMGDVQIDREACVALSDLPDVGVADAAHAPEHSLEVHLPFLQSVLGEFTLVPLVVGMVTPERVAAVLEHLSADAETLIVVSSDLSHYHDYDTAKDIDALTTEAIETLDWTRIGPEQACGCNPLNGLLHFARSHGLQAQTLDVRSSGDTAGPRDRVVGYGAWAFYPEGADAD
jgi:AmmeMemoRadiSam system protein B